MVGLVLEKILANDDSRQDLTVSGLIFSQIPYQFENSIWICFQKKIRGLRQQRRIVQEAAQERAHLFIRI